MFFYLIIK